MSESNTMAMTRTADTWPSHVAKARRRNLTRKRVAREAQATRDRGRGER